MNLSCGSQGACEQCCDASLRLRLRGLCIGRVKPPPAPRSALPAGQFPCALASPAGVQPLPAQAPAEQPGSCSCFQNKHISSRQSHEACADRGFARAHVPWACVLGRAMSRRAWHGWLWAPAVSCGTALCMRSRRRFFSGAAWIACCVLNPVFAFRPSHDMGVLEDVAVRVGGSVRGRWWLTYCSGRVVRYGVEQGLHQSPALSGRSCLRVQRRHSARRMRICWLSKPFQCMDVRRMCFVVFLPSLWRNIPCILCPAGTPAVPQRWLR